MALPLAEPPAIAGLRAEAATSGTPQLQSVAHAVDAVWTEVAGVHTSNELAHGNINAQLSALASQAANLDNRLSSQEANAGLVLSDGTALGTAVTNMQQQLQQLQQLTEQLQQQNQQLQQQHAAAANTAAAATAGLRQAPEEPRA